MQRDGHTTKEVADLAISYIARTRRQSDLSANIYFADTEVSYRDDNRHMWRFIEEGDEERCSKRSARWNRRIPTGCRRVTIPNGV